MTCGPRLPQHLEECGLPDTSSPLSTSLGSPAGIAKLPHTIHRTGLTWLALRSCAGGQFRCTKDGGGIRYVFKVYTGVFMYISGSGGRSAIALFALTIAAQFSTLFAQEKSKAPGPPCSSVPVSVSDHSGRVVLGITASNFRARVRGRPATVLNAAIDRGPRRIALLLDASASMVEPESATWKPALAIAKTLVEGLPPEDSIAFLSFASRIERRTDFTQDPKTVLQQLDGLQREAKTLPKDMRKTALWDSVLETLRLFDPPRVGDSIYVITDGDDNRSLAGPDDAEKALLATRVRFFALFPPGVPPLPDNDVSFSPVTGRPLQARKDLERVADMTGGALMAMYHPWINGDTEPLSPAELTVALEQLRALTDWFYRLEVELPGPIDKVRDWQFEVVDQTRSGKLALVLRYPRKVVPCEAGQGHWR